MTQYTIRIGKFNPADVKEGDFFLMSNRAYSPEIFGLTVKSVVEASMDRARCMSLEIVEFVPSQVLSEVSLSDVGYEIPDYIHMRAEDGEIVFGIPDELLGSLKGSIDTAILEEFDPADAAEGDQFIKYNGQTDIHKRGPLVVVSLLPAIENGTRFIRLGDRIGDMDFIYGRPDFIHMRYRDGKVVLGMPNRLYNEVDAAILHLIQAQQGK